MSRVLIYTQAFNAEKTVVRAIKSILNQTFTDWEYHIVNNGSTDETGNVITAYTSDSRIVVHHRQKNDISCWIDYLSGVFENTDAKWHCQLDSDDEYAPDFLEKMVEFAESQQLDIAACGYKKIDAETGQTINTKMLDYNLVISGEDFAEKFVEYRGFTPYLWAKLFSIELIEKRGLIRENHQWHMCFDSIFTLAHFQSAERAGIYGEALHRYFQYPSSISKILTENILYSYDEYWRCTKEFIENKSNLMVSKLNEGFLYAIYLSMIDDNLNLIFSSNIKFSEKACFIEQIFKNQITKDTFSCEADPRVNNLLSRIQFLEDLKKRIYNESILERGYNNTSNLIALIDAVR